MNEVNLKKLLSQISCLDVPDIRDYPFIDYITKRENYIESVAVDKTRPYHAITIQDQWNIWACTFYSPTIINNGQNINEYSQNWQIYTQINPLTLWNQQKVHTYQIIDWVKFLKNAWMIEWYTSIPVCLQKDNDNRVNLFKKAIDIGNYINTWGKGIDWGRQYSFPKECVQWTTTGFYATVSHCFNLIWYDDTLKRFINCGSFWADWWDNWYSYISYADIWRLFSAYVIIDKDNTGSFQKIKLYQQARQDIVSNGLQYHRYDLMDNVDAYHFSMHTTNDALRKMFGITDI